jgi:hypothetical protein
MSLDAIPIKFWAVQAVELPNGIGNPCVVESTARRQSAMARRLIPFAALEPKGIPYSKEHIRRLEIRGLFPTRVRIGFSIRSGSDGGRMNFTFVEDEIDRYVEFLIKIGDIDDSGPREKLIREFVGKLISERATAKDAA